MSVSLPGMLPFHSFDNTTLNSLCSLKEKKSANLTVPSNAMHSFVYIFSVEIAVFT